MRKPERERGSALLTVVAISAVLLAVVLGVLLYSSSVRRRSINSGRSLTEQSCAASGLQLARAYFGTHYPEWNYFLSHPEIYNPIGWSSQPGKKSTPKATSPSEEDGVKSFQDQHPELFADLDGDGQPDVYLYCRDNLDERPPEDNHFERDSDQVIIIGAMCISKTLVPRRPDGTVDPDALTAEALLKWDYRSGGNGDLSSGTDYGRSVASGGPGGSGSGDRNH